MQLGEDLFLMPSVQPLDSSATDLFAAPFDGFEMPPDVGPDLADNLNM